MGIEKNTSINVKKHENNNIKIINNENIITLHINKNNIQINDINNICKIDSNKLIFNKKVNVSLIGNLGLKCNGNFDIYLIIKHNTKIYKLTEISKNLTILPICLYFSIEKDDVLDLSNIFNEHIKIKSSYLYLNLLNNVYFNGNNDNKIKKIYNIKNQIVVNNEDKDIKFDDNIKIQKTSYYKLYFQLELKTINLNDSLLVLNLIKNDNIIKTFNVNIIGNLTFQIHNFKYFYNFNENDDIQLSVLISSNNNNDDGLYILQDSFLQLSEI